MRLLTVLLLIIGGSGVLAQTDATPTFKDFSYGPHERHKLDLWQPRAGAPAPLLIFIHGGGWRGGDKSAVLPKLRAFMLDQGIAVASINYRYSSMAPLPAPVHDAARAVQFLRSKAGEWRLDPARFGGYGVSAGGCSALWLAYHDDLADAQASDPVARQSTRLQAAVGISPQTCLEPALVTSWVGEQVLAHGMIGSAVGATKPDDLKSPRPEWAATLHEFSPITHVGRDDPPVLVTFPRIDPLPAANAGSAIHHAMFGMKLKEKADAAGAICILRIEDQKPVALPTPEAFLLRHLKPGP
jgi:arylformamidase